MSGQGGCGCASTVATRSGCGCGGAPAGIGVAQDGVFTRPTFFAGQLLTEEDLEALASYVSGKNRLHNRYLFGAGVVCGLDVGCLGSGSGSVLVRAGYALDCCGNDIVVPCDQQVDVNKLISDLPQLGGCVEEPRKSTVDGDAGILPRRYELCIEYAETAGQLVAPFAVAEDVARGCEPSRIREGYRFSLRCAPTDRTPAPSLLDALTRCLKPGKEAEKLVERLDAAHQQAALLVSAGSREPATEAPTDKEIAAAVDELTKTTDAPAVPPVLTLAALAARAGIAGKPDLARQALDPLPKALQTLRDASGADPITSAQIDALTERVASLRDRRGDITDPTRADRLLANGVAAGDGLRQTLRSVVAEARDWALSRLERQPVAHCRSAAQLARLRVEPGDDAALYAATTSVRDAVTEVVLGCVCAVVNPPCVDCVDEAVPLAVLTVEGCEVVDVCETVRRHVLTGTALRYWIPLDLAYEQLEKLCCGDGEAAAVIRRIREFVRRVQPPREQPRDVAVAQPAAVPQSAVAAPEESLKAGERQLLVMLNSQVQRMQARLKKLEGNGKAKSDV